ncbi:Nif3-like dinuclear metal center hexameric protein [Anaerolentibacter hominis]|uniref:Nif3-like dinuclear metal center hexameric protein n=1 Tax=Anaerolentibacter hominis TaxID=3079009 RepID=UPI0031B7F0C8
MNCKDVMRELEKLAPRRYSCDWDNVGLLVGREDKEVKTVMVALDATDSVIAQAASCGADLLVTHHPMLFSPIKRVISTDLYGKRIIELIRNDISYFAMHTNMDTVVMAEEAADKIDLQNGRVLELLPGEEEIGIGRFGELAEEITVRELALQVKQAFELEHVRVIGDPERYVRLAAISTGSGKSMVRAALAAGSQVLITGDIDHHTAIDAADSGLCLIDAGHFGTEHFMVDTVIGYLNQLGLTVCKARETSPFHEF